MTRVFVAVAGMAAVAAMSISVAAQAPVKVKAKTDDSRDTIVCKRFAETGSLVSQHKLCKSRADWDREQAQVRDSMTPTQSCRGGDSGGLC